MSWSADITQAHFAQVRRTLGLLHSIILSGERMSPQAEGEFQAALETLLLIEAEATASREPSA